VSVLDELPAELRVEADGPVRIVVMDRPEERNAVNRALHHALATVWRRLAADTDAAAVVLTGAGPAFSAGGDLEWVSSFLDDPVAREESLREGAELIDELLRFPLPVVAAVNGPAVGLGCSVALLCDIVLMAETAHLADPHVAIGLAAGDGGAALWPLLGPILRSREYLYTGAPIPAPTAVELGLASRTVPPDELMAEAIALAHRLAAQPRGALRATKRVVNLHLARALDAAVPAGFAAEAVTMASEEHRERLTALRRRRT
jgi:enoyl-CoA hydratase